MSSASSPSSSMQGIEKARVASRISGNCGTSSGGGGGRFALYWSYIWLRNVLSDASRITARWVGPSALLRLVGQLPQHRRVAVDRADIEAVLVGQRRQPVEGAEDVGRAVDEIEMRGGMRVYRAARWDRRPQGKAAFKHARLGSEAMNRRHFLLAALGAGARRRARRRSQPRALRSRPASRSRCAGSGPDVILIPGLTSGRERLARHGRARCPAIATI